jgi:hypothetical protein
MSFNVSASAWESDVNVSNNTSVVHVRVNITSSGESHSYNNLYGTITIDGNDYSHGAYQVPYNANLTFESTRTITHNADGAKSVNWSYSFQVKSNDTRTGSGSITLTTIARASQPSCITYPNTTQDIGYLGDTIKVHMNRKSTSFTHTVTYKFGNKSGTIATNVTDNCDWTIPLSLGDGGTGTIYAETFNGSTSVGKKSVSFTVHNPKATLTNVPNINHGSNLTATYSNPASRSIQIGLFKTDALTALAPYRNCSGTSYTFTFTDTELDNIYKQYGNNNSFQARVYLKTANNTSYLDYKTITITLKGNQKTMREKVSGTWKRGKVFIKVNGTWKNGVVWEKVNGTWKRGI